MTQRELENAGYRKPETEWVCRQWTKKADGWYSDFDRFATKEEAIEQGEIHKRLMKYEDLDRYYEVYESRKETT